MIIKSLSRKDPSFNQLSHYIIKGSDKNFIYSRNLYANFDNLKEVNKEFEDNYKFLKRQKNSNALYHEIISLTKSDIDINIQKEALYNIVDEYVKVRAKNCLVYGSVHEAHNNIHFHIMISSNEIEKTKNHYLSKKEFSEIKKGLEKFVLKKYPELKQEIIINKSKKIKSKSKEEFEFKKRTGKKTQKEIVQEKLKSVFNSSKTKQEFFENLFSKNLEIYTRGKSIGFLNLETGRKHRLKTLGLEKEFNFLSNQFEKVEHKEQKKESPGGQHEPPPKENKNRAPAGDPNRSPEEKQKTHPPGEKAKKTTKNKRPAEENKKLSPEEKEIKERREFVNRMRKTIHQDKGRDKIRWLIEKIKGQAMEILGVLGKIKSFFSAGGNEGNQKYSNKLMNERKTELKNSRKLNNLKSYNQNR